MPTVLQCSNYMSLIKLLKLQIWPLLKSAIEEKHIKQFAHTHTPHATLIKLLSKIFILF